VVLAFEISKLASNGTRYSDSGASNIGEALINAVHLCAV